MCKENKEDLVINRQYDKDLWTIRQVLDGEVVSEDFDGYEEAKEEFDQVSKDHKEYNKELRDAGIDSKTVELSLLQIREINMIR